MQDHVFFDFRPRITWLYPIWNALNATTSETLQEARSKSDSTALNDIAVAVATKLVILGTVVGRFNSDYDKLLKLVADDAKRIQLNRETGTVWSVPNKRLSYELLADIEAFIFEARSTYEILGKFLSTFCKVIFNQVLTEEDLKAVLRDRGLDVAWTTLLRDERILFFHETAPWLALMFHDEESVSFELLIVRGNVKTLDDPDNFARLADYNRIYSGLEGALEKLQQYVVSEIDRYGKSTVS
ncbi:MAG: hypothetical protein ACLQDV_07935 [Candidatus Binataceae bacterium]